MKISYPYQDLSLKTIKGETWRPSNSDKMKGCTRTTVHDGTADGKIGRLVFSDMTVHKAAWFEVKAKVGTI